MCVGLAAGLFGVILPRLGEPTRLAVFLRLATLSGVLSVGAGAMYVVRTNGGDTVSLVLADTAMVLAPALLWVGVRPASRFRVDPAVLLVMLAGASTAASAALLPSAASTAVKAGLLGGACALCAVAALRNRAIPRASMRVLAGAMTAYALFSLARCTAIILNATPSPEGPFSPAVVGGAAVIAMLLVGVSVALVGVPAIRVRASSDARRTRVAIDDWDLAAAAYGTDRVRALLVELRLAARDLDPRVVEATHGVETSLPRAGAVLRAHMRRAYGWTPEELQLLTDVRRPSRDS